MSKQLNKHIFSVTQAIPAKELVGRSNHALTSYYKVMLDALVVKLEREVLTEKLEPRTITRKKYAISYVPDTWWDHFKYTYRNRWWLPKFLKRWNKRKVVTPVTFKVKVEPMLLFPELEVPSPEWGKPIKFVDISGE